MSRVLEGVFHADGGVDDADMDDYDGWVELGPEEPEEMKRILEEKMEEAKINKLSTEGQGTLRSFLVEFGDVIKLKLDVGHPVKIEPLQVKLLPNAVPLRAKGRKYAPAK